MYLLSTVELELYSQHTNYITAYELHHNIRLVPFTLTNYHLTYQGFYCSPEGYQVTRLKVFQQGASSFNPHFARILTLATCQGCSQQEYRPSSEDDNDTLYSLYAVREVW